MIPLLAGPVLLTAYGVVRLLDGRDGSHGPGPAWTIGHLLFLAALVLFGAVAVGLGRRLGTRPGLVASAVTLIGLVGFVKVVVVDLLVGLGAADRAEMNTRWDDYATPLDPALDLIAPLFPVGLLALLVLLALARRAPAWSPVLAALAFVAITVSLDLLPLGGLLLLGALRPLTPRDHGRSSRTRPGRTPGKDLPHSTPKG